MEKPVILAVDDEPAVLAAVTRDLRRHFGSDYDVQRAGSGAEALELLGEFKLANRAVALFLADQRMPEMTGVAFLARAMEQFPDAKRVLLTAYADTDAAIRAINEVKLDHYLMKPWHPPEDMLYPVLDDLLDDWRAGYQPVFEGVRIIGHRWSADGHRVREFLARNLIPYRWLDIETDPEAQELRELAGAAAEPLPLVLLPDGTAMSRPTVPALAEKVGLHTHAVADTYDLIVVGTGPAGLASAVYGASEGLRTLLIEREAPGGQAGTSSRIENYLGFPVGLSGADLARRGVAQARRFGAEILTPMEAMTLDTQDGYHILTLSDGSRVAAQALIVATGVSYRLLDVPGADRLSGAGLFYGAAQTEALGVKGQAVFVVGAGNSAGQAALHLARYASSVTLLVRGKSLAESMSKYLIERIEEADNITVRTGVSIAELYGEESLEAVSIKDAASGKVERVPARAVFVFIGASPRTDWLKNRLQLDAQGYILSGPDLEHQPNRRPTGWDVEREPYWLETSVPGVFVAGDVRRQSTKRIASAVGEGAMAVAFVHQHLKGPAPAPRPVLPPEK
ncbi:MAG: FAD-dependent oxidoreductase [Devosia sp.]|uniref:FAD-dependent oxidoreductase n=1 Tax=Devosia sp. TaxID=1871048 RepID=UPI001AC438FF|nr:FAD-dependent oxidoreductase [Devosia sp.]MBN9316817.1 FAD-dependent oxidoreductase [Devosia sp.]